MVTPQVLDRVMRVIRYCPSDLEADADALRAVLALCLAAIEGREALEWAKTYGISAHNLMTADPLRVEELVVADRWAARVAALSRILDAIPEGGPAEEDS